MLFGGVYIGNGAVVAAGSIVTKDIPPYAIAAGNPARVVKYRFDEETIARLQRIKWWNWPHEDVQAYLPQLNHDMQGFLDRFDVPSEQSDTPDEIVAEIQAKKARGYHIYYFIPDFAEPPQHVVWPRLIDAYLSAYTAADRAALVVAIPPTEAAVPHMETIGARLAACGTRAPLMLPQIAGQDFPFSIEALQASDTYITTREDISSLAVDYAADAGLDIRYSLDQGALLFPPL